MAIKRTVYNETESPSAILTGDWHLRQSKPECRLDDFEEAQWKKVKFVCDLQEQHNCPVLHSGDLFDHWKPSPNLIAKTIKNLPRNFHTVYGNHDLPYHSMKLADESGIYAVATGKGLEVLSFGYWNDTPSIDSGMTINTKKVFVWHKYVHQIKHLHIEGESAHKLLRQYPQFDLMLTGDNHIPFVEEHENRLLVNPGCLTRQNADQIDFKPRVYLWYAKQNKVVPIFIPIEQGVISREHLEKQTQRDTRIDAFVESLQGDWGVGINFEENLKAFEREHKVSQNIMEIVYKSIDTPLK